MAYKINGSFNVPMKILIPTITTSKGQPKKTYPSIEEVPDDMIIHCNFKSFGGTESVVNGVLSVENTAVIQTWYRPDITSQVALYDLITNDIYEILGTPENIERKNQYLQFKVKCIGGGA